MLSTTPMLALVGLVTSATAMITGFEAPFFIAPASTITIALTTANSLQPVEDLSVAFGLVSSVETGSLGDNFLGSFYLGPSKSNTGSKIAFDVVIPADIDNVNFLTAIVSSLNGLTYDAVSIQYSVAINTTAEPGSSQQSSFSTDGSNVCPSSSASSVVARDLSSPSCFATMTTPIIQSSIGYADALIGDIDHGDNSTGAQNLGQLNGFLRDLVRGITPDCTATTEASWPRLSASDSKIRAIDMLRQVQDGLNALQGSVNECEVETAKRVLCQVLAVVGGISQYYVMF